MSIWIPLILLIMGIIFIYIEFVIPALGIVGGIGIICLIVATILSYSNFGYKIGLIFLVALLVGVPGMVLWGLKLFPKTFFGKKLILDKSERQEEGFTSFSNNYNNLVGQVGVALTKLRPSGLVKIGGAKYSAITSGEMIDENSSIRVAKVAGNSIVVEKM